MSSSGGGVAWHPQNLGEGRGKRKKSDSSPASCAHLGLEQGSAPLGQLQQQRGHGPGWEPRAPPRSRRSQDQACRTAAEEGEGRRSCGPSSVGEGEGIRIQTGGRLLPSALPALLEIELREGFIGSVSEAAKSLFGEQV